jgi:hypothetical protein
LLGQKKESNLNEFPFHLSKKIRELIDFTLPAQGNGLYYFFSALL